MSCSTSFQNSPSCCRSKATNSASQQSPSDVSFHTLLKLGAGWMRMRASPSRRFTQIYRWQINTGSGTGTSSCFAFKQFIRFRDAQIFYKRFLVSRWQKCVDADGAYFGWFWLFLNKPWCFLIKKTKKRFGWLYVYITHIIHMYRYIHISIGGRSMVNWLIGTI